MSISQSKQRVGSQSRRGHGHPGNQYTTKNFTDADYIARIKGRVTVTENGCWECAGFQHKLRNVKSHTKGYVAVGYRGSVQRVHRLMYMLIVGAIPAGMQVNHKCDNPPCCNPDHLFLGDQNANMRDMADKKRDKAGITHCVRGHELAGKNIYVSPTKTGFRRHCKLCDAAQWHTNPKFRASRLEYQRKRRALKRAARQEARA